MGRKAQRRDRVRRNRCRRERDRRGSRRWGVRSTCGSRRRPRPACRRKRWRGGRRYHRAGGDRRVARGCRRLILGGTGSSDHHLDVSNLARGRCRGYPPPLLPPLMLFPLPLPLLPLPLPPLLLPYTFTPARTCITTCHSTRRGFTRTRTTYTPSRTPRTSRTWCRWRHPRVQYQLI